MNKITIKDFIETLKDILEHAENRNFCFVIGSGASKKSGIPIGEDLAKVWFDEIKNKNPKGFENWIEQSKINTDDIPSYYGAIYSKRFEIDKQSGYDFLINKMKNAKPSLGHIFLAQILSKILGTCVITTNFDSLIETAIYQYTDKTPLICGHESLSGYAKPSNIHPLIMKIHRDVLLSPKNSSSETNDIARVWVEPLNKIFTNHIPIVIGYGGNDGSLMGYFKKMKKPSNFFWCIMKGKEPSERVKNLVKNKEGHFIEINGFDEIMNEMLIVFDKVEFLKIEEISKGRVDKFNKDYKILIEQPEINETEHIASKREMSAFEYAIEAGNESDYENRKTIYLEALKKYPKTAWLWNKFTYFLQFIKKDYEQLDANYRNALSIEPEHAINNGNYAIFLHTIKKDYVEAENYYRKALSVEPENASINLNYAYFLHTIKKNYVEAEKYYLIAFSNEPENANKNVNYANFLTEIKKNYVEAESYFNKGIDKFKAADLEGALADFTKAIALKPNDSKVFYNRGNAKFILENYKEAIEDFSKAIALKPNDSEAFSKRGIAKAALKNYKEAIVDSNQAIELNPNDLNAFYNRGNAKAKLENYEEAIEDYTKAISLNPNDSKAFNNRGFAKAALRNYKEAIEDYNQAIATNPNDSEAFNYRGLTKVALKNYKEAIEDYTQAIALNPNYSEAFYNRGIAKAALKNYTEAIEDYYSSFAISIKYNKKKEEFKTIQKFRPINAFTLHLIINNEIWFASHKTFNNPMDGNFLQNSFKNEKQLITVLDTILVSSFVNDTKKNSLDYDNLMWAHYSQNHSGICLVYEFINNENEENEFYIDEINYKPEIKNPNLTDVNSVMQDGFFTKNEIWKYEEEVRILYLLKMNERKKYKEGKAIPLKDLGLQLKEIIFGLKCTENDRILIYKLLQEKEEFREVSFFEMKEDREDNFFKLKKVEYKFKAKV